VEMSKITKEEFEAVESLDKKINDATYEAETGMPAITKWMQPANADELPPHMIGPSDD